VGGRNYFLLIWSGFLAAMLHLEWGYLPAMMVLIFANRAAKGIFIAYGVITPVLGTINGLLMLDVVNFGVGPQKAPLSTPLPFPGGLLAAIVLTALLFAVFVFLDKKRRRH
jgi:hypothetical protein